MRSARVKQPREFLRRAAAERISDRFVVESVELPFEYMLNVLRLTDDFAGGLRVADRPGLRDGRGRGCRG